MTSTKKFVIIAVAIVVIVSGAVGIATRNDEDEPTPAPERGRYMDIESYVRNNISELSPEKEVLGGKFFVTRIETTNGVGVVEYEDGHNAYTADFTYRIEPTGQPIILSFTVRER